MGEVTLKGEVLVAGEAGVVALGGEEMVFTREGEFSLEQSELDSDLAGDLKK